jgi:hypothetical protein
MARRIAKKSPRFPFKDELASLEGEYSNSNDREHLSRWADDERSDEVWSTIWMKLLERKFADADIPETEEKGVARAFIAASPLLYDWGRDAVRQYRHDRDYGIDAHGVGAGP